MMQQRGNTRMDLHGTNIALKNRQNFRNPSQAPQQKSEPSQKIKTRFFYLPPENTEQTFLFTALLNDYPRKGECFQNGENTYEVIAITREILSGTPYNKEPYTVDALVKDVEDSSEESKPILRKYYVKKIPLRENSPPPPAPPPIRTLKEDQVS